MKLAFELKLCSGWSPIVLETGVKVKLQTYFQSLAGLKIYFTGPSDKMSDDVELGSDICPMIFSSVLTRK